MGFFWLKYFSECILISIHTSAICLIVLDGSWCFAFISRNNTHMKLLKLIWGWHQHRYFDIHMQFSKNPILPPSLTQSGENNPFHLGYLFQWKRGQYLKHQKKIFTYRVFLKSCVEGQWCSKQYFYNFILNIK